MSRLIGSIFLVAICNICFSQKTYFVYIQSEAMQPFFIRMNDKNISSSNAGYVILPQLKDSTYLIKVGFPQSKWPEQDFSVSLKGNDRGYVLKNFNERGWGLFDLQALSVQMAEKKNTGKVKMEPHTVSLFTQVLSKAANDPSLLEKPVFAAVREETPVSMNVAPKENETQRKEVDKEMTGIDTVSKSIGLLNADKARKLIEPSDSAKKNEGASIKVAQEKAPPREVANERQTAKSDTLNVSPLPKVGSARLDAGAKKEVSQQVLTSHKPAESTDSAKKSAVADINGTPEKSLAKGGVKEGQAEKNDTLSISPLAKVESATRLDSGIKKATPEPVAKLPDSDVKTKSPYRRSVVQKRSESSTREGLGLTFIDQYPSGKSDTISILIPEPITVFKVADTPPVNDKKFLNIEDSKKEPSFSVKKSDCKAVASQNDFLKLRKKMASQKTDEAMLDEAKKEFKGTCFTTEQIKNLGALFLNEPGKFQFYEAAFPYSTDPDRFLALQGELKDLYFIHRFKNLVK